MDCGRTAYSTLMQFDLAGDLRIPVRWYFAQTGAKFFPGFHKFGTAYFEPQQAPNVGIGEYWNAVRTYSKGFPLAPFTGQGSFCGPREWFELGVPSSAEGVTYGQWGIPTCCTLPNPQTGGIKVGGVLVEPPSLCQTWYYFPLSHPRELTTTGPVLAMGQVFEDTGEVVWESTSTNPDIVMTTTGGLPNCASTGMNSTGLTCTFYSPSSFFPSWTGLPNDVPFVLTSYNPATYTGVWVPPPAAGNTTGFTVTLTIPP